MRILKPYTEIITELDGEKILKHIELCGRVAYKSEDRITDDSAKDFVKKIIKSGHESVLEHYSFTVRFVVDRAISHELVRHRMASFTQESTRYCDYSAGKFGGELTFIRPCFWSYLEEGCQNDDWNRPMEYAEKAYLRMLGRGASPQQARSVLPNSLKTEVVMTANLREWRYVFRLRTEKAAHPQMREVMIPLLNELKTLIPVVFDDIGEGEE